MFSLKIDRKNGDKYLSIIMNRKKKLKTLLSLGSYRSVCQSSPTDLIREILTVINKAAEPDHREPVPLKKGGEMIFLSEIYIRSAFKDLGLLGLMESEQKLSKAFYSFSEIYSLLLCSRILHPGSINSEFHNSYTFLRPFPLPRDSLYHYLDYFAGMDELIQAILYRNAPEHFHNPGNQKLLYDGTNIYFHSDKPEQDKFNELGALIWKALRTHGFSKENRILPILNIGLFCADEGYPVFWNIFAGREREITNIIPVLKQAKKLEGFENYTFEADRANSGGNILAYIQRVDLSRRKKEYFPEDPTDHYIVGKSIRQASKSLKEFALEPGGYRKYQIFNSDLRFKTITMKSRIETQTIKYYNEQKKLTTTRIPQLQIVYHSKPYARRESYQRAENIEQLFELLEDPSRINAKFFSGKLKYLETRLRPSDILNGIDFEKVRNDKLYDGFYVILSNLLNEDCASVYSDYKELSFDEMDFRFLKSKLELRPAFLRNHDHLKAFVTLNIVSLVIMRYLEYLLDYRFSLDQLLEGLRDFYAVKEESGYRILYENEVIRALRIKTGTGFEHSRVSYNDLEKRWDGASFRTPSNYFKYWSISL